MILLSALLPVLLFILFLYYADSFKLIQFSTLFTCAAWGLLAAYISLLLNSWLMKHFNLMLMEYSGYSATAIEESLKKRMEYSRYIAPIIEETMKMLIFIYLISKGKIGFMVDGAIYGFCVGAFFSLFENTFYFYDPSNPNPMVWVIRGFGTSMMHGGATAVVLLYAMKSINVKQKIGPALLTGTVFAMLIHSLFNHFFLNPVLSTILIILVLPPVMILIFYSHESKLRKWLDVELSTEVVLLKMIKEGKFGETHTGQYIISLKNRFSKEVIVDMLCYIGLYTELSIKAKTVMMLKEVGLPSVKEPGIEGKLLELKALQKNIGKTGLLAISPILRMSQKDIWKLSLLQ
ncbi:MAG: PrsW family glutamic-type intramembrane protease [Bacteroidetes bacterium]|nr:PrsW family glutamic-type intramembrane protease [Bacteroidota bacterium]